MKQKIARHGVLTPGQNLLTCTYEARRSGRRAGKRFSNRQSIEPQGTNRLISAIPTVERSTAATTIWYIVVATRRKTGGRIARC